MKSNNIFIIYDYFPHQPEYWEAQDKSVPKKFKKMVDAEIARRKKAAQEYGR